MSPSHHRPRGGRSAIGPWRAGLACLAVALAAVLWDAATLTPGATLTREGGSVELLSALYYLVALAAFLLVAGDARRRLWPAPLLIAAMALREFDADKRFTSEGLLSIKILTYDTALWEKLLGIVVIVGLLVLLALLIRRTARPFLAGLRHGRLWAVLVAAALALLVVSKSIDGLGRKLAGLGIDISSKLNEEAGLIEEVMELGIPILIIMAIVARFGARTPRR